MTLHSALGTLSVNSSLTNWDGVNTLTGGRYIVDDSSTLQLSSIGTVNPGTTVNLDQVHLAVFGSGLLTGDGTTNVLTGLTNITDSHTYLDGVQNLQINLTAVGLNPATLTLTQRLLPEAPGDRGRPV